MFRSPPRWLLGLVVALGVYGTWTAAQSQTVREAGESEQAFPSGAVRDFDLPQIGDPADTALSPAEEAKIGAGVVAELYQYGYILEDAQITEYLSSVGWKLAAASGANPPHLSFFMVKDNRINAFALPGGYIGFNAGLVTSSGSESEMAGVMAHELAHVTQRHIARGAAQGGGLSTIATWAAVIAAIIVGSADPDVILAALSLGQSVGYQRQINYTRAHEIEADRVGISTLSAGGYDPEGMAAFFQRLEQGSRLYGSGVPEFLRTHPVNTTRISEARTRASALPKRVITDSIEYSLMRARTLVLASNQPSDAVDSFAALIAAGQDTPGNRYGLAYALHELGQNERAAEILRPVVDKYPRQVNLGLLTSAIQFNNRQVEQGLASYQKNLELFPRSAPAILEYSEALIRAGQPETARRILLSHEQSLGTRLDTYRLLAQAAREMNNDAESSFQMATFLYLRGDRGGALSQLDAGLRLASLSSQDRARLAARRAEVRQTLPKNFDPERDRQPRR